MDNQNILKTFGLNLKYERLKNKLSQDDLAALTGFSKPYISNVEQAKHNLSLSNAYKFSIVLKVSLESLLKEK